MADCTNTAEFISDWKRMCEIVQKWSDTHQLPEEKTFADVFFERNQEAFRNSGGI